MAYDLAGLFGSICERMNSSPGISLKTLSSQIGVERHTIERAIKSVSGTTFRRLRNRVMLEKIKKLMLARPDLTMKQLAAEMNYRSQSAFSRFVKENAGCSPVKLRQAALRDTSTEMALIQTIGA